MKRELKWDHRWMTKWSQIGKVLSSPQILSVHIGCTCACPCSGQAVSGGGSWHKDPGEQAFLHDSFSLSLLPLSLSLNR